MNDHAFADQWSNTFGGGDNDHGYSVQQTSDGGYIVAGEISSGGNYDYDVYLVYFAGAPCDRECDFDFDGDVDGLDFQTMITGTTEVTLEDFAMCFGSPPCTDLDRDGYGNPANVLCAY